MSQSLILYLLKARKGEVTNRLSIQFVATRKNMLHEIYIKKFVFKNAKMNIYAILISQVL